MKESLWYKQEGELIPFTAWPWMWTTTRLSRDFSGDFTRLCAYFTKQYGMFYWDLKAMDTLARVVFGKYADRIEDILQPFQEAAQKLQEFYLHTFDDDLSKFTKRELLDFYQNLWKGYTEMWKTCLFIDSFDPGFDQDQMERIANQHGLSREETSALMTPLSLSYTLERKLHFLTLVLQLGKAASLKHPAILNHIKVYDYYQYSYAVPKHLSLQQIREEMKQDSLAMKKELEELRSYPLRQKEKIQSILQKHGLQKNPLAFFQELTRWRDERKKVNMMGCHVLHRLLEELSRRTGIKKEYLGYLNHDEVEKVLSAKSFGRELEKRYQGCVFLKIDHQGYSLAVGEKAIFLKKGVEQGMAGSGGNQIRGTSACWGKAQGPVRVVITREDFAAFQEGDILVVGMTRPEHVPLMRKAAAIITNEGGVTSHAAIVSREFGKPCIIGTKIATESLKNGEQVEVDANHGTVRRLRPVDSMKSAVKDREIKAIIFDVSGVLSFNEEPFFVKEFARRQKLDPERFMEDYDTLVAMSERDEITGKEIWRRLGKKYHLVIGIQKTIQEMLALKEFYPEMLELASSFRKKYKVGAFSNYNRQYWGIIAKKIDLDAYFDKVIISYQIKARKDEPKGFRIFLREFGVRPEEMVFIDDSARNLKVPQELGMHTIHYQDKMQLVRELRKLGVDVLKKGRKAYK